MSRSKRVAAYPAAYLDIAAAFEAGETRRTFKCATPAEAGRLRLDLYGFRGALLAEGLSADYPRFGACRFFVKGRTLSIIHADAAAPAVLRRKGRGR